MVEVAPPVSLTGNVRAFTVLVRNAMFRRVELAALRRWDELGALDADAGWDSARWAEAMAGYFDEYDRVGTGADARNPALLHITVEVRPGRCARSSTTPRATTTGASARRSISPRPTRRGSRS